MPNYQGNTERIRSRFYDKLRSNLVDFNYQPDAASGGSKKSPSSASDEELYGKISKDEFLKILDTYEKQQTNDSKDKAVRCDRVVGESFAKLLFSKPGFHHIGSTERLVRNLRIRDVKRNSFLAGHSTYDLNEEDTLKELLQNHQRGAIRQLVSTAMGFLANKCFQDAEARINIALSKNPEDGNALVARARYYSAKNMHDQAILDFKDGLANRPDDPEDVKNCLAEELAKKALQLMYKDNFKECIRVCDEALSYNPGNDLAKLNRGMCQQKLESAFSYQHRMQTSRRK